MKREILNTYEANYAALPFEDILRQYRQQNIFKMLASLPHKNMLEIGCGPDPLFQHFKGFDTMTVVEPGKSYIENAMQLAGQNSNIKFIPDFFENIVDSLAPNTFDFIIIGGFLHEIQNPAEVLQAVKKVCTPDTIIHSFVPNAHSFHRLLAYEMGLIKDVYVKSGHDELFQRFCIYNMDSFKALFIQNGFEVADAGSYFIKPFTHAQMSELLQINFFNESFMDGLDKIIKYFPANGAELFINGILSL